MMLYRLQCVSSWAGREAPPTSEIFCIGPPGLPFSSCTGPASHPHPAQKSCIYRPASDPPPHKSYTLLLAGVILRPPWPEASTLTTTLYKLLVKLTKLLKIHWSNQCSENTTADWLRLSCRVGEGGGVVEVEGTDTQHSPLSLSPNRNFDILDSTKPALKLEGALL